MKRLIACTLLAGLAAAAAAQQGGSTFPPGSNLPQRTAGEVAPKPAGQMGGSGGPSGARPAPKRHATARHARHRRATAEH